MLLKKQLEFEAIFFLVFGAAVGFLFLHYQTNQNNITTISSEAAVPTATPTPEPAVVNEPETASQISPDGTKKISYTMIQNKDATRTYKLSTDDGKSFIFSDTLNIGESMSLPFNTWSSDNSYFFIEEHLREGTHILVFTATGEHFADGEDYLDLTDVFKSKISDDILFDSATGWAEGHLIIINTKLEDGTQGPSYWFEVPSKALIPLAVKF